MQRIIVNFTTIICTVLVEPTSSVRRQIHGYRSYIFLCVETLPAGARVTEGVNTRQCCYPMCRLVNDQLPDLLAMRAIIGHGTAGSEDLNVPR